MDQPVWSFELFGFRVEVWTTFLFLALILAYLVEPVQDPLVIIGFMGVVFVSIIVHELGHAFVARRLGIAVGDIQLRGLGGQVAHGRTTNANLIAISLAGPGAGLLLGTALYLTWSFLPISLPSSVAQVLYSAVFVNVVWSIFNLLPVLPLDGGNALRAGLGLFMPNHQAWRFASISTMVLCAIGGIYALQTGSIFLALYAAWFAYNGYQRYRLYS